MQTLFTLTTLACLLAIPTVTNGRPSAMPNAEATKDLTHELESIFQLGPGMAIFNTEHFTDGLEEDEIVCIERHIGKPYCREVINYTLKLENIEPEQFEEFKDYFRDDVLAEESVESRMDVDTAQEAASGSNTSIIYPEGVLAQNSKWLLVVQHEHYKQGVRLEECVLQQEGEHACAENSTLPLAASAKCKQNFIHREMVVLVNGVMKVEKVELPNTCECTKCAKEA
ncbi:uncharacterized protein LOC110117629 [Ceratitis capitata]|uniref:uncharacterized protein LOC110117629 n=1 Tax=Ceratitis capitata TaxID=7213 RepID=UPI000A10B483|nr:uncharacterized protein LOC110117629 [Ceratitis capitata]